MGRREKLKGGDEYDILTRARRRYCYTNKPGVCRKVKRRFNRRMRRETRRLIAGNEKT